MSSKKRIYKAVSFMLAAGILVSVPSVSSSAAVITSNATDKVAVVFHEGTAYSAGDYVIYDGEMYICTEDIQGTWSQAETSFMQVTKNKELGQSADLSAEYAASKDPSEEKSLMAFAANAWQKLKGFLGIGSSDKVTNASDYRNASVSEKLNYLESQNQSQSQQLGGLQQSVTDSFQSVSNGKSLIADAIADNNGAKLGPRDPFRQYSQAVRDMALIKYNSGIAYADSHVNENSASYKDGYGKGVGYADSHVNESSASYKKGYDQGMIFADGRINTSSASYTQGKNDGKSESSVKIWSVETTLTYEGPSDQCTPEAAECFKYSDANASETRTWWFHKNFGSNTQILAVYAAASYTDIYATNSVIHWSVKKEGRDYHTVSMGDLCSVDFYNGEIRIGNIYIPRKYIDRAYSNISLTVVYA